MLDEIDGLLAAAVPRPLRVPLHSAALRFAGRGEQAMLARIPHLCPQAGRALDVGANHGLYTFALVQHAERVDAFEPQIECVANLRAFAAVFARRLNVHAVALSDVAGTAVLNIPYFLGRLGTATISSQASLDVAFDRFRSIVVPRAQIDDYAFDDVSFMKIDVEGHEESVIGGAVETIERCRPTLLVEIEQRHLGSKPIKQVFRSIEQLGYRGGFYRRNAYEDLDMFNVQRDQTAMLAQLDEAVNAERYINMFVFRPA